MLAIKGNREVSIIEREKDDFVARGYNIYDENLKLIASAKEDTIEMSKYKKIKDELEKVKETNKDKESQLHPSILERASLSDDWVGTESGLSELEDKISKKANNDNDNGKKNVN